MSRTPVGSAYFEELAEVAYLAFCRKIGSEPLEWRQLPASQRKAWREAAFRIRELVLEE